MSSHHIVRDNQEPALLFLDSENCNNEILNQLLEWSPFIIATDDSSAFLKARDVKPDFILSGHRSTEKIIEKAFEILDNGKHEGVNVFTSIDNHSPFTGKNIQISIFDENWKWTFIKSAKLKKWVPAQVQLKTIGKKSIKIVDQNGALMKIDSITKDGLISFQSDEEFWLGEKII